MFSPSAPPRATAHYLAQRCHVSLADWRTASAAMGAPRVSCCTPRDVDTATWPNGMTRSCERLVCRGVGPDSTVACHVVRSKTNATPSSRTPLAVPRQLGRMVEARAQRSADSNPLVLTVVAKHRVQHRCPMFRVVLPRLPFLLQRDAERNLGDEGVAQCCQGVFVEWDSRRLQTPIRKGVGARPRADTHTRTCARKSAQTRPPLLTSRCVAKPARPSGPRR